MRKPKTYALFALGFFILNLFYYRKEGAWLIKESLILTVFFMALLFLLDTFFLWLRKRHEKKS